MQQKIVITGGPGTGKTTLINELKGVGFFCFNEIIREMTLEAKKMTKTNEFVSNPLTFVNNPDAFNLKILHGRINQYKKSEKIDNALAFFDRGIPDVLAYMDYFNQKYSDNFVKACKKHVYDKAFLLPPWEDIYISDNERLESYEEAVLIHDHLENTYKRFGYNLIEVPVGKVADRIDFILQNIKI